MSHLSKVELEITSLDALRAACSDLGIEFVLGQLTFRWYGGQKECDASIKVPGASYELGVQKEGSRYNLIWDDYSAGGLEEKLGKGAGRLKQAYAVERIRQEARLKGYKLLEIRDNKKSVQLQLTIP